MPMQLDILLPFEVFAKLSGVQRVVVQTLEGAVGLLPRRLDCVAALTPGILVYESADHVEHYVAVDEGVLVKTGARVLVSVRRAIVGSDLHVLRQAVEGEFLALDQQEQAVRSAMARLETGFLRRFMDFQHA